MDFVELITPTDPEYVAVGRRLHAERSDLQQAYPDPDGLGFRKWLAVSGLLEYPDQLGRFFPAVPPEDLRRTGCGGVGVHSHLYTALEDFETIHEAWRIYGDRPYEELGAVLDFGCGCGRTARWLSQTLPDAKVHGCDVRRAGIDWCNENLQGNFQHSGTTPPLPFADDSMDLVVGLSLFSHFDRASSIAWLRELVRVCRPDGRLLLTTHGAFSLWVIARSAEHQQSFHVDAAAAADLARRLQQEDFLFYEPPEEWFAVLDGPARDYGQAFMTERFVRDAWGADVEVSAYLPAGLFLFQDLYVLRPRSS